MSESIAVLSNSFRTGWNQILHKDLASVKKDIMDALHITSSSSFSNRLNGKTNFKETERVAIEKVFASFGITENIWGE